MNILICSSSGNSNMGGIYEHEFDAIKKHAPVLASCQFLHIDNLHWSEVYDAEVVLVFDRAVDRYEDFSLDLDLINRLAIFSQKKGRKVYLLTRAGFLSFRLRENKSSYRLFIIDHPRIIERHFVPEATYTFLRQGSEKIDKEKVQVDLDKTFESVDWEELSRLIFV